MMKLKNNKNINKPKNKIVETLTLVKSNLK